VLEDLSTTRLDQAKRRSLRFGHELSSRSRIWSGTSGCDDSSSRRTAETRVGRPRQNQATSNGWVPEVDCYARNRECAVLRCAIASCLEIKAQRVRDASTTVSALSVAARIRRVLNRRRLSRRPMAPRSTPWWRSANSFARLSSFRRARSSAVRRSLSAAAWCADRDEALSFENSGCSTSPTILSVYRET